MWFIVLSIWFTIFATVDGNSDRKVNLALETVIKFDEPSLRSDVAFIDDMQNFLSKIKGAINDPDDEVSRRIDQKTNEKHLIDYLEKIITILLTYDDEDVKNLARILNEEIRKYHYKGCKFYELANDKMIRKVMRQTLDMMKKAPANVIRFQLNNALHGLKNANGVDKKLVDFMNSFYSRDFKEKLSKLVNDLRFYKIRMRTDDNNRGNTLEKVVKDAVKDLVFDHYSSLNDNARRALKVHINAYLVEMFKSGQLNIKRSQPKRVHANLMGLDDINKLFKDTTTGAEKSNLREADVDKVTKGLMESQTVFKDKFYEPSSDSGQIKSSSDESSDSFDEEVEVETTAVTKKKRKAKTAAHVKAKRFKTKKNFDATAMRTVWEEVQSMQARTTKAAERTQPKEKVIFEEHSAIINIGSWGGGLRGSSSEKDVNLRATDVKFDKNTKVNGNDKFVKFTDVSDEEGLTLEFDGKTKLNKNLTQSLRKNIDSGDPSAAETLRGGNESEDSLSNSDDSNENVAKKKVSTENKGKDQQPLNHSNVSDDSLPDMDSDIKFTAATFDNQEAHDSDWDARKLMPKRNKDKESNFEESLPENSKITKMSTMTLSDDEDKIKSSEKRKETAETNEEDNKKELPDDFEEIQRRDNGKDDFEGVKSTVDDNTSDDVIVKEGVETTEKIRKIEDDTDSDATKIENFEQSNTPKVTITELILPTDSTTLATHFPSESTTELATNEKQSFETTSRHKTSAKSLEETTNETIEDKTVDTKILEDDVEKNTKLPVEDSNNKITFYAKENATEKLNKHQDEKLTAMVKELDKAAENTRRNQGSYENDVKNKDDFAMPWDKDEAL